MQLTVLAAILVMGQHPGLDKAEELLRQLEYSKGLRLIQKKLAEESLTIRQQVRAHGLLAIAHSARSEPELAQRAYFEVLRLDPRFRLKEGASPKIRKAFEAALARAQTARPTKLQVLSKLKDGQLRLSGQFVDPQRMVRSALVHSLELKAPIAAELSEAGAARRFEATVQFAPGTRTLNLHVSLRAASGAVLLRWGSSKDPRSFALPAPPPPAPPPPVQVEQELEPRWYTRWWVWTLIGVGVVGASVTAAVLATRDDLLGRVEVP